MRVRGKSCTCTRSASASPPIVSCKVCQRIACDGGDLAFTVRHYCAPPQSGQDVTSTTRSEQWRAGRGCGLDRCLARLDMGMRRHPSTTARAAAKGAAYLVSIFGWCSARVGASAMPASSYQHVVDDDFRSGALGARDVMGGGACHRHMAKGHRQAGSGAGGGGGRRPRS